MPAQVPQRGLPDCTNCLMGVDQAVDIHELGDSGAFAAGYDEGVNFIKLAGQPDLGCLDAQVPENLAVLGEISLDSQDSYLLHARRENPYGYQPLDARRASGGRSLADMPLMGSPKPSETRATMSGSW